ncbi:aminotransferase class I/II-fold pyridoxal phosphate-dependent enzyme [Nocardiopsis sp. MG754419]|uniref:aminotransferase class I/II-fold pyridoxal phosphate-dependent enzyme n=1 Tax=Nocardiopsis sp. MG754419 TaxID=2259865 RepID=UPI002011B3B4|nr:aminotransferase class I/II-fold pyridoxal phosphate-dependent enzyme [Nocardiopsis sp. MG754419]MBR8740687.1 8-amino-7-oxononanoate synthase [Nocardiopsis sp. MG754419]
MERLDPGTCAPRRPWTLRASGTTGAGRPLPGSHPLAWLDAAAAHRARAGLARRTPPCPRSDLLLDLTGNDYLGLARHPAVVAAATDAARTWGAGGARPGTGATALHAELERALARFHGAEDALVFSSGYAAGLAMVTALIAPTAEDGEPPVVVCDRNNHASLVDAARLAQASGTRVEVYPHGDLDAAAALLGSGRGRRAILSDTVFSVDGDLVEPSRIAAVARAHGAVSLVDDAHGLGVVGPGGRGAVGGSTLRGADDVVTAVSLSKALGSQGGAVLGSRRVIRHLAETARTFVFATTLAPAATGAALAALRVLEAEPERSAAARSRAAELSEGLRSHGLDASVPDAAVVSVRADSPAEATAWRAGCLDQGVRVGCPLPSSVPDGRPRLRLTAHAGLDEADLRRAVRVIHANRPG